MRQRVSPFAPRRATFWVIAFDFRGCVPADRFDARAFVDCRRRNAQTGASSETIAALVPQAGRLRGRRLRNCGESARLFLQRGPRAQWL